MTTTKLAHFPVVAVSLVLAHLPRLQFNRALDANVPAKSSDTVDAVPFTCGMITLLKQYHSSHTHAVLALLGQYVRSVVVGAAGDGRAVDLPPEASRVLLFLEEFCHHSRIKRRVVEVYVPSYLFDAYRASAGAF